MRMCELGSFLKTELGVEYHRGWLKVVIDMLKEKRLVSMEGWDVVLTV